MSESFEQVWEKYYKLQLKEICDIEPKIKFKKINIPNKELEYLLGKESFKKHYDFIQNEQLRKIEEYKKLLNKICDNVADKQGFGHDLEPICELREKFIKLFEVEK